MMRWMYNFLLLAMVLWSCVSCRSGNETTSRKRVLVFYSYKEDETWAQKTITPGLVDGFADAGIEVELIREDLDFDNNMSFDQQVDKASHILDGYVDAGRRPDVILISRMQAMYAVYVSGHELLRSVPSVYFGIVSDVTPVDTYPTTGLYSLLDYKTNIRLARTLFPEWKVLRCLLFEDQEVHVANMQINELDSVEKCGVDTRYMYKFGMQGILNNMRQATSVDSVPFVGMIPQWDAFYSRAVKNSDYPFLLLQSQGLGSGFLGGYITLPYDEAYAAAQKAALILRGTPALEISRDTLPKKYVFDWSVMQKFGLNEEHLPEGSEIVERPFQIQYRTELLEGILGLLGILLALGFFYWVQYRNRQHIKTALTASENNLNAIITSIDEGVITLDRNFRIVSVNVKALELLQLPDDASYEGTSLLSLLNITAPEDEAGLSGAFSRLFSGERKNIRQSGSLVCYKNYRSFYVFMELSAVYQGDYLTGMVLVFQDITETVLRNGYLDMIARADQSMVLWQYTPKDGHVAANQSVSPDMWHRDDGMYVAALEDLAVGVHPDDLERATQVWTACLRESGRHALELRIADSEGHYVWWYSAFVQLPMVGGDRMNILGVSVNIQKQKEQEKQLEEAHMKAAESDRLKSAFLANMSHEIRTPLNSIAGFSELLCADTDLPSEDKELYQTMIQQNCSSLLRLIDDIVDLSCVQSNAMKFCYEECDVNELVSQVVLTQQVIIPSHLKLIQSIPTRKIMLWTDRLRMGQILLNLVNNAVKFTEQGSITVGYTLETLDYITFFVEDMGRGISDEDVAQIFDRYFKKYNHIQGAGLGLAICQTLVEKMGGEISVTSKIGVGTRFEVKIPFTPPAEMMATAVKA